MSRKVTLLDGAVGTSLWERSDDRNPVWTYNLVKPDLVKRLEKDFIEVGAKIILTNTFGANRPAVEASSKMDPLEVVAAGARIARQALREKQAEEPGKYEDVSIALAFGPLSTMLEPWGELSAEECHEAYREILEAGMAGEPDIIELMTFMDLDMLKIGVEEALKFGVPVFASMSFTEFGRTIMGNGVDDIVAALEPMGVAALGVNCSLGPDKALPILKEFAAKSRLPILFKPNAGIPITSSDGTTSNACTPETFSEAFEQAFPYADYVGGCCGTSPEYLKAVKLRMDGYNKLQEPCAGQ